jgi:hypothetical protein
VADVIIIVFQWSIVMSSTPPVDRNAPKSDLPEKVIVPHPDPATQNTNELGVLDGAVMGVGTAGGAAVGMTAGMVLGPIGMAAGAVVGAVAGGLLGKESAKLLDPSADEVWIRTEFGKGSDRDPKVTFDDYAFAYRFGARAEEGHQTQTFRDVEADLRTSYEATVQHSRWSWDQAKSVIAGAFHQVREYRKTHGK